MTERITAAHIERILTRMNKLVGDEVFTLSKAYGGFAVYANGGRNLFNQGHRPARATYNDVYTYCKAMETAFDAIDGMPTHAVTLRQSRQSALSALVRAYTK